MIVDRGFFRGRTVDRPAAAAARIFRAKLKAAGIGVRIVDGSGLSRLDRLTVRAVVALIAAARGNDDVWVPFRDSLARSGVSGTLETRMTKKPSLGAVRAKTGTTNLSSALSGIVSILMNGQLVPAWLARPAQDRFATILSRVASAARPGSGDSRG